MVPEAVPACVLVRKNFWNNIPVCSVTKNTPGNKCMAMNSLFTGEK
jgi:hypothetical protein